MFLCCPIKADCLSLSLFHSLSIAFRFCFSNSKRTMDKHNPRLCGRVLSFSMEVQQRNIEKAGYLQYCLTDQVQFNCSHSNGGSGRSLTICQISSSLASGRSEWYPPECEVPPSEDVAAMLS